MKKWFRILLSANLIAGLFLSISLIAGTNAAQQPDGTRYLQTATGQEKEAAGHLLKRLESLGQEAGVVISDIKKLEVSPKMADPFTEKYVLFIEQPIDHSDLSKGTFRQRVIVAHAGEDRPTVIVTEGYGAAYGLNPSYRDELSRMFNTNIVLVEHRYFMDSCPFRQEEGKTVSDEELNWDYMTAVQAAADLHRINMAFKHIYKGKWIASGISKGGQTAMFYTAYYPEDIDVSVPYVGPLCRAVEDGRHEPFLAKMAGTAADRQKILEFQKEILKRRDKIQPMVEQLAQEKKYKFGMPISEVYDYCVLEFSFAFWQWGRKTSDIPDPATADDEQMFKYFNSISGPDYFAEGDPTAPFFVQAAKELGYYGYDTKPFKGLLTIKSSKGYLNRIFVPQSQKFEFDKYLYKKIKKFLETTDNKMLFVYGQYDPWSAVMPVAPVKNEDLRAKGKGRENIRLFIVPAGSHRSRISSLPGPLKEEAVGILSGWLGERPRE